MNLEAVTHRPHLQEFRSTQTYEPSKKGRQETHTRPSFVNVETVLGDEESVVPSAAPQQPT